MPTDAGYGIPMLDLAWQATSLPHEWTNWGQVSRSSRVSGGYCFYTRDYKFRSLWEAYSGMEGKRGGFPMPRVEDSGVTHAVEVNFSTYPDQALATAIYDIYRKRVMAAAWGYAGVQVFADVNVDERFLHYALIGVPPGWRVYASRKHQARGLHAHLERQAAACEVRAGTSDITFLVFGGGVRTREACEVRGWAWHPEMAAVVRGWTHALPPLAPPRWRADPDG